MTKQRLTPMLATSVAALALASTSAWAQPAFKPFSVTVTQIEKGEGDYAENNKISDSSTVISGDMNMRLNNRLFMNLSATYDSQSYDFDKVQGYMSGWDDVTRYAFGVSWRYQHSKQWSFVAAPQMQYHYAAGADKGDSLSYAIVGTAMYTYPKGNSLGLGLAYTNNLDKVRTLPYLAINWKLSDRWTLANPFRAGLSGPAGLEARYQYRPDLIFALGSSNRAERFLTATGEVVAMDAWASFSRIQWQVNPMFTVHGSFGFMLQNEIEFQNKTTDLGGQSAAALAVTMSF